MWGANAYSSAPTLMIQKGIKNLLHNINIIWSSGGDCRLGISVFLLVIHHSVSSFKSTWLLVLCLLTKLGHVIFLGEYREFLSLTVALSVSESVKECFSHVPPLSLAYCVFHYISELRFSEFMTSTSPKHPLKPEF